MTKQKPFFLALVIIFQPYTHFINLPNIQVCSQDIPFKPSIKLLGVTIANDLSWNHHTAYISRRVHSTLYHLRMHTYNLPSQTKLSLVKSLILPIFDYNCLVFNDVSGFLELKLKKLLNSCLRYIYNIPRFAHITPYRKQANFLTPQFRRKLFLLVYFFKIDKTHTPPYIYNLFPKVDKTIRRTDRQAFSTNYILPLINRNTPKPYVNSFPVTALKA